MGLRGGPRQPAGPSLPRLPACQLLAPGTVAPLPRSSLMGVWPTTSTLPASCRYLLLSLSLTQCLMNELPVLVISSGPGAGAPALRAPAAPARAALMCELGASTAVHPACPWAPWGWPGNRRCRRGGVGGGTGSSRLLPGASVLEEVRRLCRAQWGSCRAARRPSPSPAAAPIAACRCPLPLPPAAAPCRCHLPLPPAAATCRACRWQLLLKLQHICGPRCFARPSRPAVLARRRLNEKIQLLAAGQSNTWLFLRRRDARMRKTHAHGIC
jgi:hypothetical protein